MSVRPLLPIDHATVDTFLAAHRDTSMFLRSNIRNAGLAYAGGMGEADYVGAFAGDRLAGVAGHCWNGLLLLQAPEHAADLARACVAHSGRTVTGLSGPLEQVRAARSGLQLENVEMAVDGSEWLYTIDLANVVVPEALSAGSIVCRPPLEEERETLRAWRTAYDIEILGATDSEETRVRASQFLDAQIDAGQAWVALVDGALASLSAFNAVLPDIVQLGGIYTPPERRGRGFAKAAVAHSLLVARDRGVTRAVLFTQNPSAARSYEGVGFQRDGDFSLVLFR